MKRTYAIFAAALVLSIAMSPLALAEKKAGNRGKLVSVGEDGSECYELDYKDGEAYLRQMEAAEKSGKIKQAFEMATGSNAPGCSPENGYERRFNVVMRNHKALGQQLEKAGKFLEANKYYGYPFEHYFRNGSYRDAEKNYSHADAHRTMLAYVKQHADDVKVVTDANYYFKSFDGAPPQLKEVHSLAVNGGNRMLAKEDKNFTARKFDAAKEDLAQAVKWFQIVSDETTAQARAKKRYDSLIVSEAYDDIKLAFDYVFDQHAADLEKARARASKLGQQAERNGKYDLAHEFYVLASDTERSNALGARLSAGAAKREKEKEAAETKRRAKFKEEQDDLERELKM